MHSRRPFVRHPPPSSLLSAHPPSPAPDPPLRGKQVVHGLPVSRSRRDHVTLGDFDDDPRPSTSCHSVEAQ